MITVRLPSTLRVGPGDTLDVTDHVATIAQLIDVLDRRIPGFREQLDDCDTVEIVPTISGG